MQKSYKLEVIMSADYLVQTYAASHSKSLNKDQPLGFVLHMVVRVQLLLMHFVFQILIHFHNKWYAWTSVIFHSEI